MTTLEKVARELRELGFIPEIRRLDGFGGGEVIVIDYPVRIGRYKGSTFRIGIGFQEDSYPEYPPHFVLVAALPSSTLPVHSVHHYDNADWSAFSVPPSDFWDTLPSSEKSMKTYLNRHLARFWSQV